MQVSYRLRQRKRATTQKPLKTERMEMCPQGEKWGGNENNSISQGRALLAGFCRVFPPTCPLTAPRRFLHLHWRLQAGALVSPALCSTAWMPSRPQPCDNASLVRSWGRPCGSLNELILFHGSHFPAAQDRTAFLMQAPSWPPAQPRGSS